MIKSVFSIIWAIVETILSFLKPFAIALAFVLVVIFINWFLECRRLKKKGVCSIGEVIHEKPDRVGFFRKIFIDFPKQLADDYMRRNLDDFPYKGVVIFTGRQGCGKTISLVKAIMDMQKEYPECKVITNLEYSGEDKSLKHWRDLTDYSNGRKGVIVGIDETQNWFSCYQSKNFPPEMLTVVTQNRKNARIVLGTAQNFFLLAKALRSQCTEVRECRTFFGCLTVVSRKIPLLDSDGNVNKWEKLGRYFYIHDKRLRQSYDTYKVIDNLSKSGFVGKTVE